MKNPLLKFRSGKNTAFNLALKQEVDLYFKERSNSRKANSAMYVKLVVIAVLFLGSYVAILSNRLSQAGMLAGALLFGVSMVLVAFNVSHDASHGALFKSPRWNHFFSYSFNLIGVNRYIWNIKHNLSHHAFTNVPGYDMDIEQVRIARLVDHLPYKWFYRYQHIYVPLLYPFTSLYMIFIKDFQMFATRQYGNSVHYHHPRKEYIILIVSKLFYFTYTLAVPLLVLQLPWYKIIIGFLVMHFVLGTFLALILFPAHAVCDSPFPKPDETGVLENDWTVHQIETTTNFGAGSKALTWLSGGLNIHIPHHLFPSICHVHYYALSGIIRHVAQSHGIAYREHSMYEAVKSHLRLLKKMGTPDNKLA